MSYLSFMPWTLQKRLLRYLLSQLDFLETDDLDLDNLGITWGQRSVVELKNIGLKTRVGSLDLLHRGPGTNVCLQKLSSILHLPSFVDFRSARISYLKLTIPADILTSGIVIEISGVELRLKVEPNNEGEQKFTRSEQRKAPAKGIKSNRPRIATPTIHDPGGRVRARYGLVEDPLFHPDLAVHQLAESFLQTESREDRLELQAAIASKSRDGRDSLSSSTMSEEEVGIGMAEGYTLPSFIASYLVGVADRLQLHVKDVVVHAEYHHPRESSNYKQTETAHSSRFLFRLAELCVESVNPHKEDQGKSTARRKVIFHHFSIIVLPDPSSDPSEPGSSESTSPVIKHSQIRPLTSFPLSNASQSPPTALRYSRSADQSLASDAGHSKDMEQSMSLSEALLSDKPSSGVPLQVVMDTSINDSALFADTSRILGLSGNSDLGSMSPGHYSSTTSEDDVFQDAVNVNDAVALIASRRSTHSEGRFSSDSVDNQVHAEALAKSSQHVPAVNDDVQPGQVVEDLTESRIFTHDEAESMYMSALDATQGSLSKQAPMPGAWNWVGEHTKTFHQPGCSDMAQSPEDALPSFNPASAVATKVPFASSSSTIKTDLFGNDGPADNSGSPSQIPQTAKHLFGIDRVSAWLPTSQESGLSMTPAPKQDTRTGRQVSKDATASGNLRGFSLGVHNTRSPTADDSSPNDTNRVTLPTKAQGGIEIEVLNARCQFDMQLGKALIAMANSTLKGSGEASQGTEAPGSSTPKPRLSLKVSNLEIAFLEHVPELSTSAVATEYTSHDDALLLSASLAGISFRTSFMCGNLQQQFQLTKMSLSHSKGHFLSFSHDSRMGNSMKDTVTLLKNDLEISITASASTSKVEVHTKPIRLVLELSQLDDILSRSGGLSSLLELGSSIASASTVRTTPRKPTDRRAGPRGVHFEDPSAIPPKSQDELGFGLGKLNLRVGGVNVDVVGSECTMKASTSAIKIVHRTEGVGMQIARVSLQGPVLLGSNETPELSATIQNIRMEYLPIPNDSDLDRLLAILTPSKDKYDADDDIMVDTLLRQRRKGGVLRLTITSLTTSLQGMSRMTHLAKITTELAKLSTVAKYLPEDDRPGILSLGLLKTFQFDLNLGNSLGRLQLKAEALEGAHVNLPSLLAAQVGTASIRQEEGETILGEAVAYSDSSRVPPMIMCRFVADEMDPTVKLKLFNICLEYHVSVVSAFIKSAESFGVERPEYGSEKSSQSFAPSSSPPSSESAAEFVRRTNVSVAIRDSMLALNPRDIRGRALFVVTDAVLSSPLIDSNDIKISTEVRKASIMVIDKVDDSHSPPTSDRHASGFHNEDQATILTQMGYVSVGYISSAITTIDIAKLDDDDNKSVDVEFANALLILESCADSTQTLISIVNGLSPPAPPLKVSPYRTEIVPIEDLLASFSGDAFITEPGPEAGLRARGRADSDSTVPDQQDIEYVSEFYQPDPDDEDDISESGILSEMLDSDIAESTVSISVAPVSIKQSTTQAVHDEGMVNSLLDFRDEHFARTSAVGGEAHRWDSTQNTYGLASEQNIRKSPLKVRVCNVHVIWNLFDGYDWQGTRDVISAAVKDIETRAAARRPRSSSRLSPSAEDEEESVIGDFLFNSIYIGIPANKDPRELADETNRGIDDLTSESGSYETSTTVTGSPARYPSRRPKQKKLKLKRSKQHKMTFELKGVSADIFVSPPGSGEVQSSIDVRIKDLDVFDHVPTSTWKKFATYMRDAGEREADTSMFHVEILIVKPVPDLAASEIILKMTVLPLRLHVDQDALDFMSRFFEFKDESSPIQPSTSSPPFLQRVEVNPIKIKLDFKPKRVDYGGLRSGRTTEFMNFFVLDQADMILRRVILYGVSGFERLGIMLNSIWMPDVKRNQLPGILAGIAPIRSFVNVGSGVRDLVVVPMREYRKDGRIVRSIQKGALAFAKTTSKELIGLGAKLAIGTQTVLQNAETLLAPASSAEHLLHHHHHARDDPDADDEVQKQISLYADQPIGVVQGLRGAYASLERDLLLAKDAIIAVPGEAMASGSAAGAAKAILRQAPTVILRPAIGASKAVGKTLLGAGNTLDRENWRRMEEACRFLFPFFFLLPSSLCPCRHLLLIANP